VFRAPAVPFAVLVLVLLGGAAAAEPSWSTYREGMAKAQAEGRPMLVFFDLGDDNSEFFLEHKFSRPEVQALARKFILVRVPHGAGSVWKRYGLKTGPAVMLTDSRGDLLEKGYWRSADALRMAMEKALKKFGPILSSSVRAEADGLVVELKDAFDKRDYARVYATARRLAALTEEDPYAQRAKNAIDLVRERARSRLEHLAGLEKKDRLYQAKLGYEQLVATFEGLPEAKTAAGHLARFAKDKRLWRKIEGQEREAKSAEAFAKAEKADAKRPDLALAAWEEIASRWPETEAGRRAAALSSQRRADPEAMARVRESAASVVCPGKLSTARSYLDNGLKEEARALLEQVVKDHPGTSFEAKAREMLGRLR
jgi:hypothetical protein